MRTIPTATLLFFLLVQTAGANQVSEGQDAEPSVSPAQANKKRSFFKRVKNAFGKSIQAAAGT